MNGSLLLQLVLLGISCVTPAGIWLIGSGKSAGWTISIIGDLIWIGLIASSGNWGFLPSALLILAVQMRGTVRWHKLQREHHDLEVT